MKLKRFIRDVIVILKSNCYKYINGSSVFEPKSILFKKIKISNSTIGKYTYFAGQGCVNNASVGKFCSIADGVKIGVGLHPIDLLSTHPATFSKSTIFPYRLFSQEKAVTESERVTIGNDVWIGLNAIVLDGVTVGNGAVIAAGSVVSKNVDDFAIVGGVPAKLIKYRKSINDSLDGRQWWDLDEIELKSYLQKVSD